MLDVGCTPLIHDPTKDILTSLRQWGGGGIPVIVGVLLSWHHYHHRLTLLLMVLMVLLLMLVMLLMLLMLLMMLMLMLMLLMCRYTVGPVPKSIHGIGRP
jgi:1,4-dihydroxy-2-naphthoate octaprenyltransferase